MTESISSYDDPSKTLPDNEATVVVLDHYRRSDENFVSPMRPRWNEWQDIYRCYLELEENGIETQTFVPLTFSHVESFVPRLVANRPRIEVWGAGPEDQVRAAQHRALLFYDWEIMQMPLKLTDIVRGGQVFGLQWVKLTHRRVTRMRRSRFLESTPQTILGMPTGKVNSKIVDKMVSVDVWNDPWLTTPDVDTIFPDPDGMDENDCEWIIDRSVTSLAEIKEARDTNNKPLYKKSVIVEIEKWMEQGNLVTEEVNLVRKRNQDIHSAPFASPDPHKRQFHLLEQWTDDKVVTVVEELPHVEPLRNENHGLTRKPFFRFTPIMQKNELQGISIPQILAHLNIEINDFHAARSDYLRQAVWKLITILRDSNVNPRQLRPRPGGYAWVDSHDDIQWREQPGLDVSMYREEEQIRLHAQFATGASDNFQGVTDTLGGGTATEATVIAESAGSRAGLMFHQLSEQTLRPIGKMLIHLNELHITDERMVRIGGDEFQGQSFMKITPEELLSGSGKELDLLVDVAATEPATRQAKVQQASNAINSLSTMLPPDHPIMERMISQMAEGFGIENPERLMEEGRQKIEQQRQAEAQAATGGGDPVAVTPGGLDELAAAAQGQNAEVPPA